jgi:hypothetical protein
VAVIVTECGLVTSFVVTAKLALVAPAGTVNVALVPAGTVTDAGTLAAVLPLERLIGVAAETADENVTVPWLVDVAGIVDGFGVRLLNVGPVGGGEPAGWTVSTVTNAGGWTDVEPLSNTLIPPAGALPCSCTTPPVGTPPVIGLLMLSDRSESGCTVNVTEAVLPLLSLPVKVTGVEAVT